VFSSKPGGVIYLFPWLDELTGWVYAHATGNTSEMMAKKFLFGFDCGKAAE
jgi:hypothetical protein